MRISDFQGDESCGQTNEFFANILSKYHVASLDQTILFPANRSPFSTLNKIKAGNNLTFYIRRMIPLLFPKK